MASLSTHPVRPLARAALAGSTLACLATALGSLPAAAAEGPWTQYQGGPAHPGASAEAPAPPYVERWRFSPEEGALSGAVLTEDLAIAVGPEAVYALGLEDGEVAWRIPRDGGPLSIPALAAVGGGPALLYVEGPPSAPAGSPSPSPPADETARPSELVAVALADRTELWRVPLEGTSRSGVTVDGDRAFVGDDDGRVYAVALETGEVAWTGKTVGRVESPPAVADGTVIVVGRDADGARAQVLALAEATGERVWAFAPTAGAAAVSGVAVTDGAAVFGSADRLVRALAIEDGSVRWDALTLTLFSPVSAPAVSPDADVVVADASGGVYRLRGSDGARSWEHQTNELVVRSAPVVVQGFVVVGLGDGRLVAFDAESGDLVYESEASPGLIGAIALSPEVLVAVKGGGDAGLIAFEHDPDGSLVRVVSPTVPDPGALVGAFALGAAIAGALILLPIRLLRSRVAPAFSRAEDDGGEREGP